MNVGRNVWRNPQIPESTMKNYSLRKTVPFVFKTIIICIFLRQILSTERRNSNRAVFYFKNKTVLRSATMMALSRQNVIAERKIRRFKWHRNANASWCNNSTRLSAIIHCLMHQIHSVRIRTVADFANSLNMSRCHPEWITVAMNNVIFAKRQNVYLL